MILLGLCSALHFNFLSPLQKHLTDYTKKRRFFIFLSQLSTNKKKEKKKETMTAILDTTKILPHRSKQSFGPIRPMFFVFSSKACWHID